MTSITPIKKKKVSWNKSFRNPDSPYLEPSVNAYDGGQNVGVNPSRISLRDLKELGCPQKPLLAIRANCLECCGDSPSEARKCTATGCNLWPYRFGKNPFHASANKVKPVTAATVLASDPKSIADSKEALNE